MFAEDLTDLNLYARINKNKELIMILKKNLLFISNPILFISLINHYYELEYWKTKN